MNWEALRVEYEDTDITMKALAGKYEIKPATLRSRKNREKWKKLNETKSVATKMQRNTKTLQRKK